MNPGTDWLDQVRGLVDELRHGGAPAAAGGTGHAADCRWCPVCQAASVVRGERPEVTSALADVLTAAAAALRAMAEADPSRAPEPGTAPADAARPPADPPPAVQTIEIA